MFWFISFTKAGDITQSQKLETILFVKFEFQDQTT